GFEYGLDSQPVDRASDQIDRRASVRGGVGGSCSLDELVEQAAPPYIALLLLVTQSFVGGGTAPERQPHLPLELPVVVHRERFENHLKHDRRGIGSADVADHPFGCPS